MFVIEDNLHCEVIGEFHDFGAAITELKRLSWIAWDKEPNRAPCTSWRTCGREYSVVEFDTTPTPWRLLRRLRVLDISADGVKWAEGYEQAWHSAVDT